MPVLSGLAIYLQDSSQAQNDMHLSTVYLGIIAITLLVLLVGAILAAVVAAVFVSKLVKRAEHIANTVEGKAMPMINKANELVADLTPKIKHISENAEEISNAVRAKVDELSQTVSALNETVREINGKTRVQVERADGIVTDALEATQEISTTVQNGIRGPVRQIAGVIAGVKAGIETLIERSPFNRTAGARPGRYYEASVPPSDMDL
jgi:methyl-accepting chemotaxis protein